MNLVRTLADSAARFPRKIAVSDLDDPSGRRDLSYAEFWLAVRKTAQALSNLGLEPGERVALLLSNSWEYMQSFMAIAAAGMVVVPMNTRLLEDELLHIVKDSGASLLIAQYSLLLSKKRLIGSTPLGEIIVRADDTVAVERRFESLTAAGPIELADVDADDLAAIIYTSGTTGLPKGVMLPHRAWRAVSDYAQELLGFLEDEVTLHGAPLTHGSGYLMLPTLAVGGRCVLCARFDSARTLELFVSEHVTSIFLVPSMIQMLLSATTRESPLPGVSLRALYYAGSPIEPALLRRALTVFGGVLIQSFAQTEIPMFLTVMGRADHLDVVGARPHLIHAAGKVVGGVKLRLLDMEGRDVPPGQPGEVVARGPHMMLGYWNRPDATAQTITDGWLHTGDVARFDDQGYLYIIDRLKDMIITGGSNVYAREVEDMLLKLACIKEAAVIGLPDPKWGEIVTAVLVSRGEERVPLEQVESFCRQSLPDFRRPKKFVWIDEMPRNAYGKVLKRELRARLVAAFAN